VKPHGDDGITITDPPPTTLLARLEAIHDRLDTDLDGDGDRQYAAERALNAMRDLLDDIAREQHADLKD
jgi:hypothetical protein